MRHERAVSLDEAFAGAEAAIAEWHHGANDRIRVFITPFTIVPSLLSSAPTAPDHSVALTAHDREQSRRVREIAARYGTRIHSDAFGGMIRLAAGDDYGLLGPDVHLQHCFGITPDEVRIIGETDTRITHSPGPSQGRGRCPVVELLEAGATVAITTDGTAPRTTFDLLPALRSAQLLQQVHFRDPFMLPPGKLLEMVTIDAARVLGWEDEIGSLEVGKKADIIAINLRQAHLTPNFMPVHRVVYEASGHDVDTVIVDGRVLMSGRRVLSVDEGEILARAEREAAANIERAGLRSYLGEPGWGQPRRVFAGPIVLPDDL